MMILAHRAFERFHIFDLIYASEPFTDTVVRDVFLFEFLFDFYSTPGLESIFSRGKCLSESLFIEEVFLNQCGYYFFKGITKTLDVDELSANFIVTALLIGAVSL